MRKLDLIWQAMNYLNHKNLDGFKAREFRHQKPYPWSNPEGILKEDAFQHLIDRLPDISLFEKRFGYTRSQGQKGHDRYSLEYDSSLPIDPSWHELVKEFHQAPYRRFLRKLYGFRPMKLSFHWHYTESSSAVSPHCDSRRKIGSHIFYLNTDNDWKADWGGQTLILNDHGKLSYKSAPEFSAFEDSVASGIFGNRSLIIKRTPHSWHGVKALDCPEGHFRKVFIVVIERVRPLKIIRTYLNDKSVQTA